MSDFVELDVEGEIARLRIDRAERHNSLVPQLLDEIQTCLERIQKRRSIRCLVLKTAGESFSTGGDVRGFFEHREDIASYAQATVGGLNEVIMGMLDLPQPIIAIVDGQVTGGSIGFLAASNLVYVTQQATITPYYPLVGFTPDGGWTTMVPQLIGQRRTAEVLLTNRSIEPDEAVDWGLATARIDEVSIEQHAMDTATEIAAFHPGSIFGTKQLLTSGRDGIKEGLTRERKRFVEQIQTPEAIEGMAAFLDEA